MEIEEAVNLIKKAAAPIDEVMAVPLEHAFGYVLASDLVSEQAVPSFPRSAMDGYAVSSKDISSASAERPVTLRVAGELLAGDSRDFPYVSGSAVRVMTGAMVPEGYDSVVKQEDTDYGEDEVKIFVSQPPYRNYCHIGEEIKCGETVLEKGCRIGRSEAGLIASLGLREIKVRRPVRAAVICTGSELLEAGEKPEAGKIYNSIRYILCTAIRQERLEVVSEDTCADDEDEIISHIRQALYKADVILTTGGVSVGKKDLIPGILDRLGAKRLFGGINIQPGTPTLCSVLDGKVILSLSGNPYAAMANFDLYFWPLVAELMGSDRFIPRETEAVLSDDYDKLNRMRRLVRAYASDGKVYLPASEHMSSIFGNTVSCNCYIDVPSGVRINPGDRVRIRMMRPGI